MTSIRSDGIPQKRSFRNDTISSAERNSNGRNVTKVDSLDLHLSATYDHQYDLFVNKTEIVSQLKEIELFPEKGKSQIGTDSINIIFGNYWEKWVRSCERISYLFRTELYFRWHHAKTVSIQRKVHMQWPAYAKHESRILTTANRWQYFQLLSHCK